MCIWRPEDNFECWSSAAALVMVLKRSRTYRMNLFILKKGFISVASGLWSR